MSRSDERWQSWLGLGRVVAVLLGVCVTPAMVFGSQAVDDCLREQLLSAPDSLTVGEIRALCVDAATSKAEVAAAASEEGPVEARLEADEENRLKPFTIMAHKPNYLLFAAHNFQGYSEKEFQQAHRIRDLELDDFEAQFQLSVKTPLAVDILGSGVDMFAAYTVRSFWQVYNKDISSPFRETNHEPEAWLQIRPGFELFGFKASAAAVGIVHQSNGQASTLSRSWNRVYGSLVLEKGNLAIGIKPWFRIEEDREDDDNPDITDYLGHGELRLAYSYKDHVFSLMSRNNLESGFSKGAIELGWSFPIFDYPYLKGYVQYFSGYGESLIDYDRYVNRLGVGILLTDWL